MNILPIVLYYRYGEYNKIPGVRRQKSNERVSCKRLEQKWTVMQRRVYQRQIHSVDELKRRLIDVWCGFEQSIFDETTDFERVSVLKEVTSSTACELTMLILSISVTLNVTCLSVASLITKLCQQRWPIHSCSFYNVVHLVAVNFCLQQCKNY